MAENVAQKLISAHLVDGRMDAGSEVGLRIDQTLCQDATGTLVMLELEAMGLERAQTEVSVQYVDHNLLQADERNADDHAFLASAAARFGLWFSRPGNGVSHPVHMQRFGRPGASLVGSDSHTCAAGSLGMLAMGVGGIEVAQAISGAPVYVSMPQIWGVELTGELPPWVSAKDVILEMLRRHGVHGGVGRIIEYHGPGVSTLSAMDRHVIANMGAELGATATVFPSDEAVRQFLAEQDRAHDWVELTADDGASYDIDDHIDLSTVEPLIARPSSPDNVVPVAEVSGEPVSQVVVGSSANPGTRDFAIVAAMLAGAQVPAEVSLDVNPTSRQSITDLIDMDLLVPLIQSGARLHQAGCNGCIGMGQAPATGRNSLRTFPRNFPGRSGVKEDSVWLCSPETAAAAARTGVITDPRELGLDYPELRLPTEHKIRTSELVAPLTERAARQVDLVKGPNIVTLPEFGATPETIEAPVELLVDDNISTDTIMPAGARVLPYRSNIPKMSEFCFYEYDADYHGRARESSDVLTGGNGHIIVAGANYGQGSSREHAAIVPRYLGLRMVLAESFARIHWQNLINFGVLPAEFADAADRGRIQRSDVLRVTDLAESLRAGPRLSVTNVTRDQTYRCRHRLSARQIDLLLDGGVMAAAAR